MHPNSRYQCILTTINTKQKILGFLKTKMPNPKFNTLLIQCSFKEKDKICPSKCHKVRHKFFFSFFFS